MANNHYDDEPRRRNAGQRSETHENEDRTERVRNYGREDMRDYARRSVNQGNRLRGMRSGRGRSDFESEMGRTSNRGYGNQRDAGHSFRDEDANREPGRGQMDFDYDIYDAGYSQGYDRDRNTSADYVDNFWGEHQQKRAYRERNDRDWDQVYRRNQREEDWWQTTGGRPDYTSGRSYDYGRSTEYDQDREDTGGREFDMDPGFAYEFGTDYDFMADTNLRDFGRRGDRDHEERDRQGRSSGRQPRLDVSDPDYDPPRRQEMGRGRGQRDWGPGQNRGGSRIFSEAGRNQERGQNRQPRRPENRSFMEGGRGPVRGQREGFRYDWQEQPEDMDFRYVEQWNVPGPYQGVGPSNYQRSDERIKDELYQIFVRHGQIDSSGIDIDVQNGEVILSGDVDRRSEKYLAEDIASSVMGVREVTNRIRVIAGEGARVRGMGREDVVMPGRIQAGMRVAGVDGKHIGQVREVRGDGFILDRQQGGDTFIPFRAVKRTNGQIILHIHGDEIDRQGWKENR